MTKLSLKKSTVISGHHKLLLRFVSTVVAEKVWEIFVQVLALV